MTVHTITVFKRFERLWHWLQAASIFTLLFSGLEIHGVYTVIGFGDAVTLHTWTAGFLLFLWMFTVFWLFTTGEWRQYLPTSQNFIKVALFYSYGIFKGEEHPYRKTYRRKHNPLQALTYSFVKYFIFPGIWISGIAYMLISFGSGDLFSGIISMEWIALAHTIAAIAIMVFIIAHIYLLTTGHSFIDHVKPMITGYDKVDLTDEELAYLQADEPGRLKNKKR
ncbi:MAG: cytochrome B [Thiothrix sp.]|nr:MAG: cytochrome B [Thiothrix sp.]